MEPITILTEQLLEMARGMIELLPQIVLAIVVLLLTWGGYRIGTWALSKALSSSRIRPSLKELAALFLSILIWTLGLMIAAVIVFPNLTPASILAGLGIGSVAIGFAFKDVFENFLAGIIILFRKKMRIGDHIECEGIEGRVTQIAVRESHIRQTDGQLVIVPNAMLFKNPLTIRTDQDQRRVTVICGVAYDEDVDKARDVIRHAVKGCDTVITDGFPIQIFAREFNSSSIDFEVTWWTGSKPVEVRRSRDEVVAAVKRGLDEAGIEIPFPYRTLTFKEPLPLARQGEGDQ